MKDQAEAIPVVLIPSRRGIVYAVDGSIFFCSCGETPTCMLEAVGRIRFLRASPKDDCCAFYSEDQECIYVVTLEGHVLWHRGINTDKTVPIGLRFSTFGDAIACFDDWDGGKRCQFFNLTERYGTAFGPSGRCIGVDRELRRFLLFDQVPGRIVFNMGGLVAFHPGEPSLPGNILLFDRRGTVRSQWAEDAWPVARWLGAAVDRQKEQVVVADGQTLSWVSWHPHPHVTQELEFSLGGDTCDLTISGYPGSDTVLVRAREWRSETVSAALLAPAKGVMWTDSLLASVWPCGEETIVQHSLDNRIKVIGRDGKVLREVMPGNLCCLGIGVCERKVWVAECRECHSGDHESDGRGLLPFRDLEIRCAMEL
jgi:hypothetical protein